MNTEEFYQVDFKLDLADNEPLQIKIQINGYTMFRPITRTDQNLFEYLSNAQKNNLNQIGLSRNIHISGRLYGIEQSNQLLATANVPENHVFQVSAVSKLLLSVLIHGNQTKSQIELYKKDLDNKFKEANMTQIQTIVIVNPNQIKALGLNVVFDKDDRCYGKILIQKLQQAQNQPQNQGQNQAHIQAQNQAQNQAQDQAQNQAQKSIIYLIPKNEQSKFQLMQLIFLALARHFQPKYLYIQELQYELKHNIFQKTGFKNWGAICPLKKFDTARTEPLYLEFQMKYNFYTKIQNDGDSYNFDALNCFYNYQKCDLQISNYIRCQGNESLTRDMDHLNPLFCKLLNQDDQCLIQYGQMEQKYFETNTKIDQKIKDIKLNQEIQFMTNQFLELNPSLIKQYLSKLIALIDYFSLSSCNYSIQHLDLFIILILPYYFILDQTSNQAIQVFISIIPGFIVLLTVIVTIIVTIIFSIDEKILTGKKQEKIPIYIYKKQEVATVVFNVNDENGLHQILPSSGKIEKEKLLISLDATSLPSGANKVRTSPFILFIPTEIFDKWFIVLWSVFYLTLSIGILYIYIANREGDSYVMACTTLGFLGSILIIEIIFSILSLESKYQQLMRLLYTIVFFIEVNLLASIFIQYNKSRGLEQNYYKLQKFLVRIFLNFIILFAYIMFDYGYNFDGGVICPIVGYYAVKYIAQFILLCLGCLASRNIQEGQADAEQPISDEGIKLIDMQSKIVADEFRKYQNEQQQGAQQNNQVQGQVQAQNQQVQQVQQVQQNSSIQAQTVLTQSVMRHSELQNSNNQPQQNQNNQHQRQDSNTQLQFSNSQQPLSNIQQPLSNIQQQSRQQSIKNLNPQSGIEPNNNQNAKNSKYVSGLDEQALALKADMFQINKK